MNKLSRLLATRFSIALFIVALSPNCFAQSSADLTDHLELAAQALSELDEKAMNCMSSFSLNLGEAAALLCDEFMRAVDGELLASYISSCAVLNSWLQSINNSQSSGLEANVSNELTNSIQTRCGDNALATQTNYVVDTFNTLSQRSLLNQTTTQSMENRLAEFEQQSQIDSQRRALQQSIENQRLQREQATQSQFRALENELIRQQINNRQ